MREGVHSGSLWAVARTPLFCSHFHKAWRGGWRSYIGVADRAGEGVPSGFPYRGKKFSIAWKTGCRRLLSSSSGRRRGSTIHLSSCCEAERHASLSEVERQRNLRKVEAIVMRLLSLANSEYTAIMPTLGSKGMA